LVALFVFWLDTPFDTVIASNGALISVLSLKKLRKVEKLPFKSATLTDRGGDISKRWYISFWVWDAQKKVTIDELKAKHICEYIDSRVVICLFCFSLPPGNIVATK
jgi:hypothetical protein